MNKVLDFFMPRDMREIRLIVIWALIIVAGIFTILVILDQKPILIEYRNQSCERNTWNGLYEPVKNITEYRGIENIENQPEYLVNCPTEVKLVTHGYGFYKYFTICYRCVDLNQSIIEGIVNKGEWVCPA